MTKDEIIRKKQEYVFNCVTTYFKDPMVIDHAKGQYVWDIEGKQFLDFLGGIVTISVGHSNPKVTEKIKAQIDKVQHTSTLFVTEAMVNLAEKVASIAPGKLKKSYFTNSGTEANEVAIAHGAHVHGQLRTRWRCGTDTAATRTWPSRSPGCTPGARRE